MNDVVICEPVRTPVGAFRGALCAAAMREGRFDDEIVPTTVPGRRGAPAQAVIQDEHPRPGTTLERLAALRPVRLDLDPHSTVTAGNSSGQNDGVALCIGGGQGLAAVFEALR